MKNPPFDSLVWGSLRLAPISVTRSRVNTHNSIKENTSMVYKLLGPIGHKPCTLPGAKLLYWWFRYIHIYTSPTVSRLYVYSPTFTMTAWHTYVITVNEQIIDVVKCSSLSIGKCRLPIYHTKSLDVLSLMLMQGFLIYNCSVSHGASKNQ